jgi:hypothetical protein
MPPFQLPVARYRFTFRAETVIQFPAYAGSTWRGAFGHALRRTVCVTHQPECKHCLLQGACVYSYVFETPAGHEPLLEKINAAPHPYVLHPLATSGKQYVQGECFDLYLTLMGNAVVHLPYLIHTLQQVGERGLGKGDGRCQLLQVAQASSLGDGAWHPIHEAGGGLWALPAQVPQIPTLPASVRIHFRTPLRVLQDGKLVHGGRFNFQSFFTPLMRRISLLHAHHAGAELVLDFKALSQRAAEIPVLAMDLRWYEWSRYSNRQQTKVQMGGLLGSFGLPVEQLAEFWPWLWLGQWVNVGKGAVMGMGEYAVELT